MSGITSGVGLISGLPTADLIDQLMSIERVPVTLLEEQVAEVQAQRTAYADISARLLAVKASVSRFQSSSIFSRFGVTSSDSSVLTASAGENASIGSYQFRVRSLVTNHQLVGRGFSDADVTPVGSGTMSIEIGNGKVRPATYLGELNGGEGVTRGTIRITDHAGNSADVDLTGALTVDDVIREINSQADIDVEAGFEGDHLYLRDVSGGSAGRFSVVDLSGGRMAADLGLNQSVGVGTDTISSADLIHLTDSTSLSTLNDGNGIRRHTAGKDFRITQSDGNSFEISLSGTLAENPRTKLAQLNNGEGVRLGTIRITDRAGTSTLVDLSGAETVQDVLDEINGSGSSVSATVVNSHLQLTDSSLPADDETAGKFTIEDVDGSAAGDLGIAIETNKTTVAGSDVFRITTVGDVIRAINLSEDNDGSIVASISADGNGITLTDSSGGSGNTIVEAVERNGTVSQAAHDLGLLGDFSSQMTSRDLISGINTVLLDSLNGGAGVDRGEVRFTTGDGTETTVDFSDAQTLAEMIDLINATGTLSADVNEVGNGIVVTDVSSGSGAGMTIEDLGGTTTAADLGIAGTIAGSKMDGGNLQLRYVSENSLLDDLNYGEGISTGEFEIHDSAGKIGRVRITENQRTLNDVIRLINSSTADVTARINDNGDGLIIEDNAGGTGDLEILDLDGGTAAIDLNIAGEGSEEGGVQVIDGSYEIQIDIDADDTLDDVALKINEATTRVQAGVMNDGSPVNGFRLNLSSQVSGTRGELLIDSGRADLGMETLVQAQDAVLFMGGAGGGKQIVVTSSTNSVTDVLEGVTLDLLGTSDESVGISVTQDMGAIESDLESFVDAYNNVLGRIDDLTAFDEETLERGVLMGDSTVQRVQNRLHRAVTRQFVGTPEAYSWLFTIGVKTTTGGELEFDTEKFRLAYESSPSSVEALFTTEENGVGDVLDNVLDELTRSGDGLITNSDKRLSNREELYNDRIEHLEELLDRKRTRLERQFTALENSLSDLQSQQTALESIASSA